MGKTTRILLAMMMLLLTMGMAAPGYANDDDLDNYKFRITGDWWFSQPGGYFGLRNSNNYFDLHGILDLEAIRRSPGKLIGTSSTSTTSHSAPHR